eukprot:scaffold137598_cov28-Prasinocladus_malaysianus.AAC.1
MSAEEEIIEGLISGSSSRDGHRPPSVVDSSHTGEPDTQSPFGIQPDLEGQPSATLLDAQRSPSSPPWHRLGPSSDSGDPSGSGKGCSCLYLKGAAHQARQACREFLDSLPAAWESFSSWLKAEEPPSRYVALIPLS